jgi:molybdopterin-synthase adenylyltransferase
MNDTRYDRQTRLPMIGEAGQRRLSQSHVGILGCGALGSVAAEILARAGVGTLSLIDRDIVEWTNLQRQSLYTEADAVQGRTKVEAAVDALGRVNSQVTYVPVVADVTANNIAAVLSPCDLVIDAADNFALRFLLNDYSLERNLPWVHGGCVGTQGQIAFFFGAGRPCFRCLVPQSPPASSVPTCDTAGVLGSATHVIASLQATEALKWLTGNVGAIRRGVWSIDFWTNRSREVSISDALSDSCPACGLGRRDYLDGKGGNIATVVCGRQAVQLAPPTTATVDLVEIANRWQSFGDVTTNRFFARVRFANAETLTLFRDGRALVEGTDDVVRARTMYAQLVGE